MLTIESSFPQPLPQQAAGQHHWSCCVLKQLAFSISMFYKERPLGQGRQSAADFRGPLRHADGELFVAAAPETCMSSSVLLSASPLSPSSVRAESSLEQNISFWGLVQLFCKWTPGPCGY